MDQDLRSFIDGKYAVLKVPEGPEGPEGPERNSFGTIHNFFLFLSSDRKKSSVSVKHLLPNYEGQEQANLCHPVNILVRGSHGASPHRPDRR